MKFIGAVAQATSLVLTRADEPRRPVAVEIFLPRTLNNMRLFCRSVAEL